jgi:hypothetical protein
MLTGLPAHDDGTGVLITGIEQSGLALTPLEQAGDARSADIVLGRYLLEDLSVATPMFALGVRLHWKYAWHPRFHLWLPCDGTPAAFVPALIDGGISFRIADGRLFADATMPFASLADRERGILAAHAALISAVKG